MPGECLTPVDPSSPSTVPDKNPRPSDDLIENNWMSRSSSPPTTGAPY